MTIDWHAVITGVGTGVTVSILYFAGLALSVRLALRLTRPIYVLLPSAALRIGLLLSAGWLVTDGGTLGWAFAGYALAFFLVRFIATLMARLPRVKEAGCN
ncbi:ATP synthase subunit I [Vreelandella rituensis]|uniref:ATP synthase subunit AtpR n=2 Tax=Vreelandella rituensis TaxID=2282306 RepID=A0A368TQC2_9GAMM|nr:ATP synthase subunit I [Halomonas rituensis]RCV86788.1 ATP synthase subunit AtpR [Halomonas rituensis]